MNPSLSEIVNDLDIKGNQRISDETILVLGDIDLGTDYNTDDLSNEEIGVLCNNVSWKNNGNCLSEHYNYEFNKRLLSLFPRYVFGWYFIKRL